MLSKEKCNALISEAFRGSNVPDYTEDVVNKVFSKLSSETQEILMYKMDGLKFTEIGRKLDITPSRVRHIYYKGLKDIRWSRELHMSGCKEITEESDLWLLDIPSNARYALARGGCKTVGDITKLTIDDLFSIRNLGTKYIDIIVSTLNKYGFSLAGESELPITEFTIKQDFDTIVMQESLSQIYCYCKDRTEKYGYSAACKKCPYKGVNGSDCMFNHQPRIWVVEDVK